MSYPLAYLAVLCHKQNQKVMDKVIFTNIPIEELEKRLSLIVETKLNHMLNPSETTKQVQEGYATRIEVAEKLRISLPTLHNLTKQGLLIAYRINRRVLYRWDEIEKSLTKVESNRYQRRDLR